MSVSTRVEDLKPPSNASVTTPSPAKRLKIVERYSTKMLGPFPTSAMRSYRQQQDLRTEINRKRQRLSQLHMEISTCKTENTQIALDNYTLEDTLEELKAELAKAKKDVENLRSCESDSVEQLQQKLHRQKRAIDADLEAKLLKLKESLLQAIEDRMSRAMERLLEKRRVLREEIAKLTSDLQTQSTETNRALIKLKEDHHRRHLRLKAANEAELEAIAAEIQRTNKAITHNSNAVEDLRTQIESIASGEKRELAGKLHALEASQLQKHADLQLLRLKIEDTKAAAQSMQESFGEKANLIENYNATAQTIRPKFHTMEMQRRALHNKLQELKGNIRVFCRIRPVSNGSELAQFSVPLSEDFDTMGKQVLGLETASMSGASRATGSALFGGSSRSASHRFQFDKVFSSNTSNTEIFQEISQLVQSSLDGYNVCVFAYGQTGSGKTWTMSHENDGMIPLSLRKIFEDIKKLKPQGYEHVVYGQFLEIYNEQLVDLLSQARLKLEIKHDESTKKTTVTNCQLVKIKSAEHAQLLLTEASRNRSTASTMANSRSSRSHSVFIFKIHATSSLGQKCEGTLNLIDLAGSERLNSSQAKGDRLRETQYINSSLSSLGTVIHRLLQNLGDDTTNNHVPYRDSKLTYLLQYSLGGNSKTLMFVNVSPLLKNVGESVNSLRFATKVNATKMR